MYHVSGSRKAPGWCVRACMHVCVRACMCTCMCACVHACACACVRVVRCGAVRDEYERDLDASSHPASEPSAALGLPTLTN